MFNFGILIKNNILKILGPFGFQESGALAFDHIVDFHDYITVYLIFIFVLVIWVLLYSVNISKFPNFVMFFISLWYSVVLFIKSISFTLMSVYNEVILTKKILYHHLITSSNGVQTLFENFFNVIQISEDEYRNVFQKQFVINTLSIVYYIFSSLIQLFNIVFGYLFFTLREAFIVIFIPEIELLFSRIHDLKLKKKEYYYFNSLTKMCTVFGIHNYNIFNTTNDICSLYFANIINITFKCIIIDLHKITSIFVNYNRLPTALIKKIFFFSFDTLKNQNLILSHVILFFNNGSKLINKENFYNNIKMFFSSKKNVIRFARRITHASTLEIIWTIFPSFILLLIAVPSLILLYELDAVAPVSLGVKIIGRQWYWSYSIGNSFPIFKDLITLNLPEFSNWDSYMVGDETSQLRLLEVDNPLFLPAGIPITLFITASDVIHSWAVPALGIKVDAIPGRLNQVSFTIYDTSIFYGQCSELCGVNHGFMPIQIISLVDNSHLIH